MRHETRTGWLITQRSQVRILSPLPVETALGGHSGAVFMPFGNTFGNISGANDYRLRPAEGASGSQSLRSFRVNRTVRSPIATAIAIAAINTHTPTKIARTGSYGWPQSSVSACDTTDTVGGSKAAASMRRGPLLPDDPGQR